MTERPKVWVLNLDAEHELEAGKQYQATERLKRIVELQSRRLIGELVGPDDIVLTEANSKDPRAAALPGLAWCPTPSALARLEAAGAVPVQRTPLEVLREVNARPFAAKVRSRLEHESFAKHHVFDLEDGLGVLSRPSPNGWLVRRTFGAAGRGRRRIRAGRPDAAELAWLEASLRLGPLIIEPWVEITREYTRSAWLSPTGEVRISRPCFQRTTSEGAWTETTHPERGEVVRTDDVALEEAVASAGEALHRAGYSGPFGVDAYRHVVAGTRGEVLNPMSEINARFTMDWSTAMAEVVRDGRARQELDVLSGA